MKNDFIEEWKDVIGYEGYYMVSNLGRVYAIPRKYIGGYGAICSTGGDFMTVFTNVDRGNRHWVGLCKKGKPKQRYVNDLVGEAFIPNPENKPETDHICPLSEGGGDEVFNLRWVTHKENMDNKMTKERLDKARKSKSYRLKQSNRMKENNPIKNMTPEWKEKMRAASKENIKKAHDLNRKKVCQYTLDGNLVNVYNSVTEAANKTNNTVCNISSVLHGRQQTSGGYIWKLSA